MSRTHHHGIGKPWSRRLMDRWMRNPGHWTREYMNRPKRIANRRLTANIRLGRVDPDGVPFPLGNGKPEIYFW